MLPDAEVIALGPAGFGHVRSDGFDAWEEWWDGAWVAEDQAETWEAVEDAGEVEMDEGKWGAGMCGVDRGE